MNTSWLTIYHLCFPLHPPLQVQTEAFHAFRRMSACGQRKAWIQSAPKWQSARQNPTHHVRSNLLQSIDKSDEKASGEDGETRRWLGVGDISAYDREPHLICQDGVIGEERERWKRVEYASAAVETWSERRNHFGREEFGNRDYRWQGGEGHTGQFGCRIWRWIQW